MIINPQLINININNEIAIAVSAEPGLSYPISQLDKIETTFAATIEDNISITTPIIEEKQLSRFVRADVSKQLIPILKIVSEFFRMKLRKLHSFFLTFG